MLDDPIVSPWMTVLGSGANSTNSTPYGGANEVRVASFASFLHIERLNSSS